MTSRIAACVMFVAGIVGLGVLFGIGGTSVLAQTGHALRSAKSCRVEMKQTMQVDDGPDGRKVEIRSTMYWKAPDSYRLETQNEDSLPVVQIVFPNKEGLWIDKGVKKYRRTIAGREMPLKKILQLGQSSGKADRNLGVKRIDGVDARGFEIAMKKIDSRVQNGMLTAWVSDETHLPVLVEYRIGTGSQAIVVTWQKFKWNLELKDSLFDTTPPKGYEETTPPRLKTTKRTTAEFVEDIVVTMKIYAELFDGKYPPSKKRPGIKSVTLEHLAKQMGFAEPERKIEPKFNVQSEFLRQQSAEATKQA